MQTSPHAGVAWRAPPHAPRGAVVTSEEAPIAARGARSTAAPQIIGELGRTLRVSGNPPSAEQCYGRSVGGPVREVLLRVGRGDRKHGPEVRSGGRPKFGRHRPHSARLRLGSGGGLLQGVTVNDPISVAQVGGRFLAGPELHFRGAAATNIWPVKLLASTLRRYF